MRADKAIEKALEAKVRISRKYNIHPSSIVWMGDGNFIFIKDGKEIRVKGA